jgi:hypothetical protein
MLSSLIEKEKLILKFFCEAQKILSNQRNHQLLKPACGFQKTRLDQVLDKFKDMRVKVGDWGQRSREHRDQ